MGIITVARGSYSHGQEIAEKVAQKVTVHRFRVQRSGLRTKKALKTRSPRYKCSFSQVIADLAPNFGLGLTKMPLFS